MMFRPAEKALLALTAHHCILQMLEFYISPLTSEKRNVLCFLDREAQSREVSGGSEAGQGPTGH